MKLIAPALVLVCSALLAGCGAFDGEPQTSPDTSETPAPAESAGSGSADLASVQADVETLAVSLESFYRGTPYPQTIDEVVASLPDAGLALSPGNTIGGYVYDPDAVEFTLCVEDAAGAWASYDTAPMSVRDTGSPAAARRTASDATCPSIWPVGAVPVVVGAVAG